MKLFILSGDKHQEDFHLNHHISLNNFSISILDITFDIVINQNVHQSILPLYLQDNRPRLCSITALAFLFVILFFIFLCIVGI